MADFKRIADTDYIYFLNDPKGEGLIFFRCIRERHKYARSIIHRYLDINEGWSKDVTGVITGTVTHLIAETNATLRPDELDENNRDVDGNYWDNFSKRCGYQLTPVEIIRDESLNIFNKPVCNDTDDSKPT